VNDEIVDIDNMTKKTQLVAYARLHNMFSGASGLSKEKLRKHIKEELKKR